MSSSNFLFLWSAVSAAHIGYSQLEIYATLRRCSPILNQNLLQTYHIDTFALVQAKLDGDW